MRPPEDDSTKHREPSTGFRGRLLLRRGQLGPRTRYALKATTGQIAFASTAFLGSVVAARLLGAAGKGEYTAWTLGTLTAAILLGGSISVGLGRAYLDGARERLLGVTVAHGFAAAALVAVLLSPLLILGVEPLAILACGIVAVPAWVMSLDVQSIMQAAKRPWAFQGIRLAGAAVYVGGLLVVAVIGVADPLALALLLWGLGSVASACFALRLLTPGTGGIRAGELVTHLRHGRGGATTRLIDWLLFRVDQFLVLLILGPAALGVYSVAVNWSELAAYVGHSVGGAVFENERTLSARDSRRVLLRVLPVMLAVSAVVILAGALLISPIFGGSFGSAVVPLLLLGPGMVSRGLGYTGSQVLLARGAGSLTGRIMAVALAAGLLVWVPAVPALGIEGAAAGASFAYCVQALLMYRAVVGQIRQPGRGPSLAG